MEKLLHYVWKHKMFPVRPLLTTTGESVEVIDAGLPNANAGPDFFNAKVRIGGTMWVGNIEIHDKATGMRTDTTKTRPTTTWCCMWRPKRGRTS